MGRKKLDYETDRLTFTVPKAIKKELYKKFKPFVKKEVNKWRNKNN